MAAEFFVGVAAKRLTIVAAVIVIVHFIGELVLVYLGG
jgi:hypothetical protein